MWMWLVGLLMAANVALVATIWLKPNMPPPGPPPPNGGPINFKERLNLSPQQESQFQQMTIANKAKIDSLKKLGKEVRERFFANLKVDSMLPEQLETISNQLGTYHKLIEMQTFSHFREVRKLLDDKQKTIFDSLIVGVLQTMPEQPHFKDDGSRRPGPPPMGGRPPAGMMPRPPAGMGGPPPPPPPGAEMDGPPPPPPDGR